MIWNIVKGVVAAVLVKKITERYFKNKNEVAPVQLKLDMSKKDGLSEAVPAKATKARRSSTVKPDPAGDKPLNDQNDPSNATESTI